MREIIVKRILAVNDVKGRAYDKQIVIEATTKKYYQVEAPRSLLGDANNRTLVVNPGVLRNGTVCISFRKIKSWAGAHNWYYYAKWSGDRKATRRWMVYEMKEMNECDLMEVML